VIQHSPPGSFRTAFLFYWGIVQRGLVAGTTSLTMQKEFQERLRITKNRASLIAVDQVGKLNGQLTELRQTNLGIEGYIWRNSEDRRVRDTHQASPRGFANRKFTWTNPPAEGHPGQPIRCRCYAEPDFGPVFAELSQQV